MEQKVIVKAVAAYDRPAVEAAVEAIFAAIPAAKQIGPGKKIVVKPNLLSRATPDKAITTHPEILRATLKSILARGADPALVLVAESGGGVYNPGQMKALYKTAGLWDVCEEMGITAYTECKTGIRKVENGVAVTEFELLQPVLDADLLIDLAKLKTHEMTGMTAATKNLFGCVPGLKKAEWHMRFPQKEQFGHMLIDLRETVAPAFAIVDGIVGMEGEGPGSGDPRSLGVLLAGEDTLTIDLAIARMMGLDPMVVPYLKAAQGRGLCAAAIDTALLEGDVEAAAPVANFRLPTSYQTGGHASVGFAGNHRVPAVLKPAAEKMQNMLAPHPVVEKAKCIGCGRCKEICPQQTITITGGKAKIHAGNCIRCFCCHEMCPAKAIDIKRWKVFGL